MAKWAASKPCPARACQLGSTSDWTDQFDGVGVLAGHQVVSIYIPGVHQMFCWQEVLVGKSLVDGFGHAHILGRGRSRFHMNDQMRSLFIAGFCQVDFLSRPEGTLFDTHMSVEIVRGGNEDRSRRNTVI
jgi:hypothetical protein